MLPHDSTAPSTTSGASSARLVPSRMLTQWTYCPRLGVLEWVHGEWADNAYTVEGTWKHRRQDRPTRDLPPADSEALEEAVGGAVRSLWLSSEAEGLTARMDVVEVREGELCPVDTKRGPKPPDDVGAWEADRTQIAAQALVLLGLGRVERVAASAADLERRDRLVGIFERLVQLGDVGVDPVDLLGADNVLLAFLQRLDFFFALSLEGLKGGLQLGEDLGRVRRVCAHFQTAALLARVHVFGHASSPRNGWFQ